MDINKLIKVIENGAKYLKEVEYDKTKDKATKFVCKMDALVKLNIEIEKVIYKMYEKKEEIE